MRNSHDNIIVVIEMRKTHLKKEVAKCPKSISRSSENGAENSS